MKKVKKRKYTKRSPVWRKRAQEQLNKQRSKQLRKVALNKRPLHKIVTAKRAKIVERMQNTKAWSTPRKPQFAYLVSFPVTGMQYYNGFDGDVGNALLLKPLDDNPYDPFAIAVHDVEGNQIGWFPREIHPVTKERYAGKLQISLHRLLKAGTAYRATVQEIRVNAGIIVRLEIAK